MFDNCSLFWNTFYQSAVGQVLIDLNGHNVAVNRAYCTFTGYSEEELLNKSGIFLIDEKDLQNDLMIFSKLLKEEMDAYRTEKKYIHKNGNYVWGFFNVSLIKNKAEDQKYFFVQVQDITEEKITRDYLMRTEKVAVAAQLAVAVAHEIRNPLTSIKGFTQLQMKSNQYNDFYTTIMLKELQKIETIITEYLELGNPQTETSFQEENIVELIEQVITLLQTQANMANQHIIFVKPNDLPKVECNAAAIKQTLVNIIKNALEAIDEGETVLIKIKEPKKNNLIINIIDSGCGISKERLYHIGEPYYSTKERGTGLGLMTCFNTIEKHNGTIHIESEINYGTTVKISLPLQQERKNTPAVSAN